MQDQQLSMKCEIINPRLFARDYILLIVVITAVAYGAGFITHFRFEGVTVGLGLVMTLLETYFINKRNPQVPEGFLKINKDMSDKFVFRKNPAEVLGWPDRMSFQQFQMAMISALTLLVYFLLKMVKS